MQSEGDPIPRFIVGMPRASTTWLAQALNQHPDVAVFGETMFFGRSFVPPGADGKYDAAALAHVRGLLLAKPLETTLHISGPGVMKHIQASDLPNIIAGAFDSLAQPATPGQVFSAVAKAIARAEQKPGWIEKTPHHILQVPRILQQFPNARFVIMVRDPYSFMLSYKFQPGYQRTAESRRRFERRYHALAPALVWRRSWLAAQRVVETMPGQGLIVRVEDIRTSEAAILSGAEAFLGLRPNPETYRAAEKVNSSFDGGAIPELAASDIAWMNLLAGEQIRAAGYQLRKSSLASASFLRSVAGIPTWGLRFVSDRRSRRMASPGGPTEG